MCWKVLKLQRLLDRLFDERWFNLGQMFDDSRAQKHEACLRPQQG
jgi:hypothetical protein